MGTGCVELLEQPLDACGIRGGVAGRMDPRRAAQSIHTQTGVIGQGPLPRRLGNGFGFQAGVRGKGVTGLLHLDPCGLGLGVEAQTLKELAEGI